MGFALCVVGFHIKYVYYSSHCSDRIPDKGNLGGHRVFLAHRLRVHLVKAESMRRCHEEGAYRGGVAEGMAKGRAGGM